MSLLITELPAEQVHRGPLEVIEMTWDERCKPRRKFLTDRGTAVALSLERGTVLGDGFTVYNGDDRTIIVKARAEAVLVIRPSDSRQLCEVAHHLGNWHRSLQFTASGEVVTEVDQPLIDWLERSGITHTAEMRPYDPTLRTAPHD